MAGPQRQTGGVLQVIVDRDSVAMGDDVEPHGRAWEFADGARVGDVVVRIVDELLASVMGAVAWRIDLAHEPVVERGRYEDRGKDRDWVSFSSSTAEPFGMVFVTPGERRKRLPGRAPDTVFFSRLTPFLSDAVDLRTAIVDGLRPGPGGEYAMRVRYLTQGGLQPLDAVRSLLG
jgi:hypothetical protein